MSTYYGYRCKKDGAVSDHWFQSGQHILNSCVHLWPAIKQIKDQDTSGYLDVTIMASPTDEEEVWNFLREHYEHGLEIQDEYGRAESLKEYKGDE